MVKPKHIVIAGLVLVATIVTYFIFSQSEAEKIKKQFAFIAEKMEKSDIKLLIFGLIVLTIFTIGIIYLIFKAVQMW